MNGGLIHYALMASILETSPFTTPDIQTCCFQDKSNKCVYHAQRTGSYPIQQSLPSKPNPELSYSETGPEFFFKPDGSSKTTVESTSVDVSHKHKDWSALHPIHDPHDPIGKKTSQRTIKRQSERATKRPSPSLIPNWASKIIPLAMILDLLEKLAKKKSK
ncbi:hypothetical protein J3R30DRAFT_3511983 [Lentinula aciculospora]|uniref:Uncharacterized protein n=1 Tax=Lentinula aciculospora TaxID=153920 RepID=A0A9W9A3S3_9AGAR|nr:hypothetical protein J3R30DRAFT_3511983 [Lentinula aciculospora]